MKKNSQNTGITLIALVITIIVMLILVGVTINMAVNGGLFKYAGEAATETKSKMEEEKAIGNIREGMSTDELIGEITTNKEEDLAKLKEYFIGKNLADIREEKYDDHKWTYSFKNNNTIPDAITSIKQYEDTDYFLYIKYHYNTYEIKKDQSTDILNDVNNVTGLTCVVGRNGEVTRFVPKDGETWYEWATDESNDEDVTMVDEETTPLSLKEVITSIYQEYGENREIYYSSNFASYYFDGCDNQSWKCSDAIIKGGIYFIWSLI